MKIATCNASWAVREAKSRFMPPSPEHRIAQEGAVYAPGAWLSCWGQRRTGQGGAGRARRYFAGAHFQSHGAGAALAEPEILQLARHVSAGGRRSGAQVQAKQLAFMQVAKRGGTSGVRAFGKHVRAPGKVATPARHPGQVKGCGLLKPQEQRSAKIRRCVQPGLLLAPVPAPAAGSCYAARF